MSLLMTLQSASLAQLGSIELHFTFDIGLPILAGWVQCLAFISMLSNTLRYVIPTLQPGCSVCATRMHLEEWNVKAVHMWFGNIRIYVYTQPSAKEVLLKSKRV